MKKKTTKAKLRCFVCGQDLGMRMDALGKDIEHQLQQLQLEHHLYIEHHRQHVHEGLMNEERIGDHIIFSITPLGEKVRDAKKET